MTLPAPREAKPAPGGVIWITGYSGAGKSTVARAVKARLEAAGRTVVLFDGDDLRSIFADRWGYARDERTALARVYLRLCSHVAAQGATVILSAVAMYAEVRAWARENVPRTMQVYLRVPEAVRRARDEGTKRIYAQLGDTAMLYDEPDDPDLMVDNHGGTSPEAAADAIRDHYLRASFGEADRGRAAHWAGWYAGRQSVLAPSPFAQAVAARIGGGGRLVELGCGDGRDALFFAAQGLQVAAVDTSAAAIAFCRAQPGAGGIDFRACSLEQFAEAAPGAFDHVYSRFVLHAMPVEEERRALAAAARLLAPCGTLHVECRSINDPLAAQGEVISPTERLHGHYRRFLILEELAARVAEAGFEVVETVEGKGLAPFGDEDPVVIRLRAVRRANDGWYPVGVLHDGGIGALADGQIVFHGTNKCGSLALARVLGEAYGRAGRGDDFISTFHRITTGPEEVLARIEAMPRGFFADHYLYGFVPRREGRRFVATLRHPLPRILSIHKWKHKRALEKDPQAAPIDLATWLEEPATRHFAYVNQFGIGFVPDHNLKRRRLTPGQVLAAAKGNAARDFAAFAIAEYFEESIFLLAHLCGLPEVPQWRRDVRNPGRLPVSALAPHLEARIRTVFAADFAFYDWVLREHFFPMLARIRFGPGLERYKADCIDQYGEQPSLRAAPSP